MHSSQQQQAQLKELFRLADPDHSKSIDPTEFREFLKDLQTLESEPALLSRQGWRKHATVDLFAGCIGGRELMLLYLMERSDLSCTSVRKGKLVVSWGPISVHFSREYLPCPSPDEG